MHKVFYVHSFHFRDCHQNVLLCQRVFALQQNEKEKRVQSNKINTLSEIVIIESAWRPLHVTLVYVFYQYIPHLVCNMLLSQFN